MLSSSERSCAYGTYCYTNNQVGVFVERAVGQKRQFYAQPLASDDDAVHVLGTLGWVMG